MACTIASIPVAAVTCFGTVTVSKGSSTAISGMITGDTTPIFSLSPVVTMAIGVTSEPVPAVVGTSINGSLGPIAFPIP